ncbi:MAG: hypothetical protein AAGE94_17190 [Acidobacteriota bacterium]
MTTARPPRSRIATTARSLTLALLWVHPLGLPATAFAAGSGSPSPSATIDASRYACWSLGDALDDLRTQGLGLVWSSDLVHPDMQIREAPDTSDPEQALRQMLDPFGLTTETSSVGDLLLIVPSADRVEAMHHRRDEALLPLWSDAERSPAVWKVAPGASFEDPPQGTRFLVLRPALDAQDETTWADTAFALKNALVDVESRHPELEIAFDGSREDIERLLTHGLAPYIHGYVHDGEPWRPAADASARTWRRVGEPLVGPDVLDLLLDAGAAGDRIVLFDETTIDPLHHAFLERLAVTPGAALDHQPPIRGIDAERVRFFLDPDRGDYVLAVHGDGAPHTLRFNLPQAIATEVLFPESATFEWIRATGGQSLELDGRYPYTLFRLRVAAPSAPHVGVDVTDTRLVDPYEEVVKNQVFQDAEREKFRSLDVMEYLTSVPQWTGGDQITWEHRILQRAGRLTEYHHLGFTQNGVRYPEDKLLKGRLFRNEALVQLDPLDVELDETYRYTYLGEETIGGRLAHHIAFEPLRRSSREDGSFVRGEVWLDVENHAHLAVRAYQEGLDGQLIYQDRTRFYEWIPSGGECFWDWRRREGTYVVSSLGQSFSVATETLRTDFHYNRPDIDQIAQDAYDSDLMIHVETPPEGHRWLVKRNGERRLAVGNAEWEHYPADGRRRDTTEPIRHAGTTVGGCDHADATSADGIDRTAPTDSGRVLAEVHAFSERFNLSMGGFGSDSDFDLFPGLVFTDNDFRDRGEQAFVGLFRDFGIASIAAPGLFDRGWIGTVTLARLSHDLFASGPTGPLISH